MKTIARLSLGILLTALSAFQCLADESLEAAEELEGAYSWATQIPGRGDYIVVPVEFPDQTLLFLVDTGSKFCVCIDEQHRQLLGGRAAAEDQSYLCIVDEPCYQLPPFRMGSCEFNLHGICRDLTNLRQDTGYDIDGILGATFLWGALKVEIDFDNKNFRLSSGYLKRGAELHRGFKDNRPFLALPTIEWAKLMQRSPGRRNGGRSR